MENTKFKWNSTDEQDEEINFLADFFEKWKSANTGKSYENILRWPHEVYGRNEVRLKYQQVPIPKNLKVQGFQVMKGPVSRKR